MNPSFWRERWATGQIGWHREQVNASLRAHLGRLTHERPAQVLVPLCGKSRDLLYLLEQGHAVVGVEMVEQAVRELFAEQDVEPQTAAASWGTRYEVGGLTMLQADFFDVSRDDVGPVDCAYDRAALIAMPPESRGRYVAHLLDILPADARILLVTLSYDASQTSGPPFSVPDHEVRERFEASCVVECLASATTEDVSERLRQAGARESVWLLTRRREGAGAQGSDGS